MDQITSALRVGIREGKGGVEDASSKTHPYSVPPDVRPPPKCTDGVPVLNQNWGAFFYFVAFVLFCALILLNLYTGADRGVGGPCEWSYP